MTFLEMTLVIITILLTFNIFLAVVLVFFERRNPVSTWAWLMVLLFIPILGFIFYLFFGQDGRKQKMFIKKWEDDEQIFNEYIESKPILKAQIQIQKDFFKQGKSILNRYSERDLNMRNFEDLANMHLTSNDIIVTYNNKVKLFHDGKEKFEALINDIKNAESYIHLEYYILKNDELGKTILNELIKKVKAGIEVKLMYDGMGGRELPRDFFSEFIKAGGETGVYLKTLVGRLNVRVNYRNHRKIAVIDGKIGYTGGFNIGTEYLGMSKKLGYWRDTHARFEGDCVDSLELRFIMDWKFVSNNNIVSDEKYFPKKNNGNGVSIQIVSSGPDTKRHQIKNGYFKMINEAEKSIYIATPYFIPDDSLLEAIKVAALAGLDVRVLMPGKPDHPFVYWANLSYAGELLNSGVKFYQYDKNSFVHSKLVMVDGKVCSVGTANMDVRSFKVNFEVNAFIYDRNITEELETEFIKDIGKSKEITSEVYHLRSFKIKFYEAISRLISPML